MIFWKNFHQMQPIIKVKKHFHHFVQLHPHKKISEILLLHSGIKVVLSNK